MAHKGNFSNLFVEPMRNNSPRHQDSKLGKKVLGTPIGAKPSDELVDGDGDGLSTGGIVGGEDKIPVVPKPKLKNPSPQPFTGLRPKYSDYFKQSSQLKKDFEKHIEERIKKGDSRGVILFRMALFERNKPAYIDHYAKLRPKLMNFYYEKYSSGMGWQALDILKSPDVPKGPGRPKKPRKKVLSEGVLLFKGVPKARKKPPTVTSTDINNLAIRVRQHNAKAKATQRANLRDLKSVYLRGLQDGDKTSANKRVSKFLSLLMSDKPKDVKYFDDNDLLPLDHPWRNRKTTKKWAGFDDGEYGIKYAEKCCPQVVKRYHAK